MISNFPDYSVPKYAMESYHFRTLFYKVNLVAPGISPKPGKWGILEKSFQNAVQECLIQVVSALQSKVMAQT